MTLFFKRQQHPKLSWLDKDSDKNQSQFDELSIQFEHMFMYFREIDLIKKFRFIKIITRALNYMDFFELHNCF
jgi:hypothetical protein